MKKTGAQAIIESRKAVQEVLAERFGVRGAITGAASGAAAGSVIPGIGTIVGGIAGGIAGAILGHWVVGDYGVNHDNANEFLEISKEMAKRAEQFIEKYHLDGAYTAYKDNNEGKRYWGIIFHEVGGGAFVYDDYASAHGKNQMTFFARLNDTGKHALKANFASMAEKIWYQVAYSYEDPAGDHGSVQKSKWTQDLDEAIAFMSDLMDRHPDIFARQPADKPRLGGAVGDAGDYELEDIFDI